MSAGRSYQAVVIEWITHELTITAADQDEADELAYQLWNSEEGRKLFRYRASGVDGIEVEEMPDAKSTG